MATRQPELNFYSTPGEMTSAVKYSAILEVLPTDVCDLTHLIQGLLIHEYMTGGYGITIPEERKAESHIRKFEQMLERLLAIDPAPLATARPPERRLVGVCDHFMRFLVALLRASGISARGRYGFGSYFNPGYFEDHSVCEYWNAARSRWVLVDPQFDEVWRARLNVDHDVLDVSRDHFLVAGDAWVACRGHVGCLEVRNVSGRSAPTLVHCREPGARSRGAQMEILQWDVWGAMPRPQETLEPDHLVLFDRLAAITREPDASPLEPRQLYETDDRLRVPATVFYAVLNRAETI